MAYWSSYWHTRTDTGRARPAAPDFFPGRPVAVLRRIGAAASLLGAATEAETVRLLERVPGAEASTKVAIWLRDLYAPTPDSTATATAVTRPANWLGPL